MESLEGIVMTADEIESRIRSLITGGLLHNHAVAERLDLPLLDLQALNLLALADRGLSPSDLATALRMPRPSVSRMVRRLEEGGYVRREADPSDRRGVTVTPEPEALSRVTAQYRDQSEQLRAALAGFDDAELLAIGTFLERLTDRPGR